LLNNPKGKYKRFKNSMYNGFTIEEVEELIRMDIMSISEYQCLFGMPFSTVAWTRRRLGVKKLELEYWTEVQVKWLRRLYPHVGDLEIAQIFNEAYPKRKGWTLKHIEKKRLYLGLKRTPEQLRRIKQRNKLFGCWMVGSKNTWQTRGEARVGEVRIWKGREYIKTKQGFEILARRVWMDHYGAIPKDYNVVIKDRTKSAGDITNLECISNCQLAQRNSFHRYPLELKRLIKLNNRLKNIIYEHQNNS
jgi:hypothetical protein